MKRLPLNVILDSNIFYENKYDFEKNSTLSLLINYVQDNKIKLFLSNIVVQEVKRQIDVKAKLFANQQNKKRREILRDYSKSFLKFAELDNTIKKLIKTKFLL